MVRPTCTEVRMSGNDRLMLWGAAGIMVAVASLAVWKESQVPAIHPEIAALAAEHRDLINGPARHARPASVPAVRLGFLDVVAEPKPVHDFAGHLRTRIVDNPQPPPVVTVDILSIPVPKTASSTLDATTITWS